MNKAIAPNFYAPSTIDVRLIVVLIEIFNYAQAAMLRADIDKPLDETAAARNEIVRSQSLIIQVNS